MNAEKQLVNKCCLKYLPEISTMYFNLGRSYNISEYSQPMPTPPQELFDEIKQLNFSGSLFPSSKTGMQCLGESLSLNY